MDDLKLPRVTEFLRQRLAVLGTEPSELATRHPDVDSGLCEQLVSGTATLPLPQLVPIATAVAADPLELLRHHLTDCAPAVADALAPRLDDALTRDELGFPYFPCRFWR